MSNNITVYRAAAKRVRKGWAKGDFISVDGGVCLLQSVSNALGYTGRDAELPETVIDEIWNELVAFYSPDPISDLPATMGQKRSMIMIWNDAQERRKRHVVRFLYGRANRLEQQAVLDEVQQVIDSAARQISEEEDVTAPTPQLVGAC